MKYNFFLFFLLLFSIELHGQDKPQKIVLLGSAFLNSCEFTSDSDYIFFNSSVPDFSSGQLFWTLTYGVIAKEPDFCIIQTGSIDILLGIPSERIIDNIMAIHSRAEQYNIKLMLVEDYPLWNDRSLKREFSILNEGLRSYCNSNDIPFLTLNDLNVTPFASEKSIVQSLSPGNCSNIQATIIKHLRN